MHNIYKEHIFLLRKGPLAEGKCLFENQKVEVPGVPFTIANWLYRQQWS